MGCTTPRHAAGGIGTERLSRRKVLLGACSALLGGTGAAIAAREDSLENGLSDYTGDTIPGSPEHETPVVVKIGVVAVQVSGVDTLPGGARDKIEGQTARIEREMGGAYRFVIEYYSDDSKPDETGERGRGQYSKEQLKRIAKEYYELGRHSLILVVMNIGDEVENMGDILGVATQDSSLPLAILRMPSAVSSEVIAHELGHLLSPQCIGVGLGHELMMNCQLFDAKSGKITRAYAFNTIQKLLDDGCDLVRNPGGEVNQYASPYSVMGNIATFSAKDKRQPQPLFSPPQMAFLSPFINPILEKLEEKESVYELSRGHDSSCFAVEVELPESHALRKLLPEAEKLFFGLIVSSTINDKVNIDNMGSGAYEVGVFATWQDGRKTALLDVSPPLYDGAKEKAIYADEDLNFIAVAGHNDDGTPYVRFVELNTPEGTSIMGEAQRQAAEQNRQIVGG